MRLTSLPSACATSFANTHPRPASGVIPTPDADVKRVEDARQLTRHSPTFAMSALGLSDDSKRMPPRPAYGTEGTPITVYANYVQLTPRADLELYMYDVKDIQPEVVGRKCTQVIRLLVNEAAELAPYRDDMVTDFKSTLISRTELDLPADVVVEVTYKNEGEDAPTDRAQVYKVPVKFIKKLTVGELMAHLTSTNPADQYAHKLDMIQGLNIFLKHYAKTSNNLATIGTSKTFATGASGAAHVDIMPLGQGLNAVRGFFTSVRAATNRILVNINVSHGAFYQEGLLTNLIRAFSQQPFGRPASLGAIEKFIKRLRVRTTHLKEKKNRHGELVIRAKTIHGLAKPHRPKKGAVVENPPMVDKYGAGPKGVQFWLREQAQPSSAAAVPGAASEKTPKKGKGKGKPQPAGPAPAGAGAGRYISVYDYFKNTYGIETSNDNPVVNVGTDDNPSYLPAEVCVVLPCQSAKAKLSGDQTRNMISFAVRKPWENAQSIEKDGFLTAGLSSQSNKLLGQFGLTVGQSLITVPARILKEPSVLYQKKTARVVNGSWNMADIKFNTPGKLKRWSYLALRDANGRMSYSVPDLNSTIAQFTAALRGNGVDLSQQTYSIGKEVVMQYPSDPALEQAFRQAQGANFDLLLVILPGTQKTDQFNQSVYSYVKTLGDTKAGIHTICVIGDKFCKNNPQYFGNVALKFNLKLGGNNQSVEQSRLSFITEDKTMLVGIDVTHPSPGSQENAPSVAGMVASTDRHLGQWPATLRTQTGRQEMVDDLKEMLKTHLGHWLKIGRHSALPENILVYRDGVGEGQYEDVLNMEVPLLQDACKEVYPPDQVCTHSSSFLPPVCVAEPHIHQTKKHLPRLTVIIVGKRHHTRFFPTQPNDMDTNPTNGKGSSNLKPGTVVDRGVTEEGMWDFFLQSHAVLQGTGRPAHYVVVLDEIFRGRVKGQAQVNVANEVEKLTQALCYSYSRATKAVSLCTPAYHADILCERARRYLADVFEGGSDAASTVAGSSTTGGIDLAKFAIHPKLVNTMFYI